MNDLDLDRVVGFARQIQRVKVEMLVLCSCSFSASGVREALAATSELRGQGLDGLAVLNADNRLVVGEEAPPEPLISTVKLTVRTICFSPSSASAGRT